MALRTSCISTSETTSNELSLAISSADEGAKQRHQLGDAVFVEVGVGPSRLSVEEGREGDDLRARNHRPEDLRGALAVELGQLVVQDDEVRLVVEGQGDGFRPVRGLPDHAHALRLEEEPKNVPD